MPLLAKQMHHSAVIRSMSTREADHNRGKYYMHTGYVPNPSVEHPSYGAVIAHELQNPEVDIPPFVSIGTNSYGPGFLGMSYAPFVVSSNGQVRNLDMKVEEARLMQRMSMLSSLEKGFNAQGRGQASKDHAKILDKTLSLMTSSQMEAFKIQSEPQEVKDRYGTTGFAQGVLMARRLREVCPSSVEVGTVVWQDRAFG
jgi:hypothetical protein